MKVTSLGYGPGAGQEVRRGIERARDHAQAVIAQAIDARTDESDNGRGVNGAHERAATARRDVGISRFPARDTGISLVQDNAPATGQAVRRSHVTGVPEDGRDFTGFFSNVSLGSTGRPGSQAYKAVLNVQPIADFVSEYNQHRGHFDDHIGASILGFRELQTIVGSAIAKTYSNADMLDIALRSRHATTNLTCSISLTRQLKICTIKLFQQWKTWISMQRLRHHSVTPNQNW